MDELYQAKLSRSPPRPDPLPLGQSSHHHHHHQHQQDIHIQPHPNPSHSPAPAQPVPIQLPNIYVNPFPPQTQAQPQPQVLPVQPPSIISPLRERTTIKIGPWNVVKPHPLLWISLFISLISLILGVPKGSLPTITGRHKALRQQERLVSERLHLLTRLSTFLPPPLSSLVDPSIQPTLTPGQKPHAIDQFRFWNANVNARSFFTGEAGSIGEMERWWSIEELGHGASVVKSKNGGDSTAEREVWVLRVGGEDGESKSTSSITTELATINPTQTTCITQYPKYRYIDRGDEASRAEFEVEKDDWEKERLEDRKRREEDRIREKMRVKDVEGRERKVGRREQWVLEEMRKLSDKIHAEASELTLEDKITERLKLYQRQVVKHQEEKEKEI